jgi:hypothetical protein
MASSPDASASYAVSVRWASALPYRLPSDSDSRQTPLPSANGSPCRARKGLTPSSECALPGAPQEVGAPTAPTANENLSDAPKPDVLENGEGNAPPPPMQLREAENPSSPVYRIKKKLGVF